MGFNTITNIKAGKIGSFSSKNGDSIKYVDYRIDQLEFNESFYFKDGDNLQRIVVPRVAIQNFQDLYIPLLLVQTELVNTSEPRHLKILNNKELRVTGLRFVIFNTKTKLVTLNHDLTKDMILSPMTFKNGQEMWEKSSIRIEMASEFTINEKRKESF